MEENLNLLGLYISIHTSMHYFTIDLIVDLLIFMVATYG